MSTIAHCDTNFRYNRHDPVTIFYKKEEKIVKKLHYDWYIFSTLSVVFAHRHTLPWNNADYFRITLRIRSHKYLLWFVSENILDSSLWLCSVGAKQNIGLPSFARQFTTSCYSFFLYLLFLFLSSIYICCLCLQNQFFSCVLKIIQSLVHIFCLH